MTQPALKSSTRILVVEDNPTLALGLRSNLEFEGYDIDVVHDGHAALAAVARGGYALVLLDLMLPGADGYRVLRSMREAQDHTPVLVLTARGDEADKVRGLQLGADDYVTKPFGLMELLARVAALLRRASIRGPDEAERVPETMEFGDVRVDPATHTVRRSGEPVALRPKEYDLLLALLKRQGQVATRHELLQEVWGYSDGVMSRTLDTHVGELRRKLEDDPTTPRYFLTVRKTGYRLAVSGD